ncbi:peptidase u61 ld-carboxypeptidase a [Pseudomassariella vexata]|uniref:Peptidase u61 ld-carboxypeptidase a n=1 Tax=Pseudomassariella vexata TaxID=1141098 RepID=A0A1Y2E620_9PEZI|nr:peptidase u61 ld-carboxypeptidase a [Pseudomassariella vexata]ORY67001.1 peptidase u61 ld-carboxypeptidase a [Pseudomassariella vexata]
MYPTPILARALQPGDTIAFISPSARPNETLSAAVDRAKSFLESHNFHIKIFWAPNTPSLTIIQSITHRITELRSAFLDAEVSSIICTIGGPTATELIPTLLRDAELIQAIKDSPKIFVGYSDISTLHWFLAAKAGLRSFYGPTAIAELGVAPEPLGFTVENLFRAITQAGTEPLGPLPQSERYAPRLPGYFFDFTSTAVQTLAPTPQRKWLRHGTATGPLFGGCLSVVVRLQGLKEITPDWKRKIMFVETAMAEMSIDEGYILQKVRQAMADLAAAGVFEEIVGLLFGRFFGYDTKEQMEELESVIGEALAIGEEKGSKCGKGREFPVLMHADFGHTSPMVTLPMGARWRGFILGGMSLLFLRPVWSNKVG